MLSEAMARQVSVTRKAYDNMIQMLSPYGKNELCHLMGLGYAGFLDDNCELEIPCPVLLILGEKDRTGKVAQYNKAWTMKTGYPLKIIEDAKLQYTVACNAVETVLVAEPIASEFCPRLSALAEEKGITLYAPPKLAEAYGWKTMKEEDYHTEYGDLKLSVGVVSDVREAVSHINRYGSHHTDAIITSDDAAADYFLRMVDSAGVYRNCSTRFADGFRYGFGAEVGIGTGKLHARGPVGLEGLVTYKYEIEGSGQIVGDYASGRRSFHFRDL